MKKLFAVLLVVLLVAAPAAAAEKTLGLVISTLNNPFFVKASHIHFQVSNAFACQYQRLMHAG